MYDLKEILKISCFQIGLCSLCPGLFLGLIRGHADAGHLQDAGGALLYLQLRVRRLARFWSFTDANG